MVEQELLDLRHGNRQAAQERRRDNVSGWRTAGEGGDLSEEVAAGKARTLFTVDHDLRLAFEDDEKATALHALSQHALTLGEHVLADRVRDLLELRPGEVGEQRQLGERLDHGASFGRHGASVVRLEAGNQVGVRLARQSPAAELL
jgi:hypothetical protein